MTDTLMSRKQLKEIYNCPDTKEINVIYKLLNWKLSKKLSEGEKNDIFDPAFNLKRSGKSDEEIRQELSDKIENEPDSKQSYSLEDLLNITKEDGLLIKASELVNLLQCCGLPEKDEYAQDEFETFLSACQLYKKEGKTYAEIAAHFKIEPESDKVTTNLADNLLVVTQEISDINAKEIGVQAGKDLVEVNRAISAGIVYGTLARLQNMTRTGELDALVKQQFRQGATDSLGKQLTQRVQQHLLERGETQTPHLLTEAREIKQLPQAEENPSP
ncbi:hypothetical protein [Gloeothece verrucosa]|uniref:Uncharacterized protein n=1 Tax=Gloeothece verrucosa (strain PCC 7822) TaxID=497965 RepID=E0UMP6_GLOV7|nr:hypothetical protein [Gloeothece verrucosa]ADN18226.1 hypothetical protein Cyan7822_6442 [Gloeothece verrucosa PCC 7822]